MKPKPRNSKWKALHPRLKKLAGRLPKDEIARQLGVTPAALSYQASKIGVSLRLQPGLQPLPDTPEAPKAITGRPASSEELEAASRLLRRHGYCVLLPDPFRDRIDAPRLSSGA